MRSGRPVNQIARRLVAITLWLLLTAWSSQLSPDVPSTVVLGRVFCLSMLSAIAFSIYGAGKRAGAGGAEPRELVAALISLAIPVATVLRIGPRAEPFATLLTIAASIPVGLSWMLVVLGRQSAARIISFNDASSYVPGSHSTAPDSTVTDAANRDRSTPHDEPIVASVCLHDSELNEEYESEIEVPESTGITTQWMTRSLAAEGEIIEGGVQVDFSAGQRDVTVHVPFYPPFQGVPEVTTEDLDGVDLEIRVAAVFPFGLRLTVRRPATRVAEQSGMCRVGFVVFRAAAQRVA